MSRRKGKSPSNIAGHDLTWAEFDVLNAVHDYLRRNAGDSHWSPNTSPKGDGREVPVREIFGAHNNQDNARRRTLSRLNDLGILKVCEIQLQNGMLKGVPCLPSRELTDCQMDAMRTYWARIEEPTR